MQHRSIIGVCHSVPLSIIDLFSTVKIYPAVPITLNIYLPILFSFQLLLDQMLMCFELHSLIYLIPVIQ